MKTFYVREQATGEKITSPGEVYESLKNLGQADQESVWIIGYSAQNREIYRECVFLGGVAASIVDPKIVFKRLLLRDCAHFIMVHNHPGGNPQPSDADHALTQQLKFGGKLLAIDLLDHLIIGENTYYSMQEHSGI